MQLRYMRSWPDSADTDESCLPIPSGKAFGRTQKHLVTFHRIKPAGQSNQKMRFLQVEFGPDLGARFRVWTKEHRIKTIFDHH
jgi:hypothetical protein